MNPASTGSSSQAHRHPAPHRGRLSALATWFGLVAAPVAWGLQQSANAALAAHGCYPHDKPANMPIWGSLVDITLAIDALACLACIAAAIVAWRSWRATQDERPGSAHRLLAGGDGRTRFMAMTALMTSILFLVAVLVAAGGAIALHRCAM